MTETQKLEREDRRLNNRCDTRCSGTRNQPDKCIIRSYVHAIQGSRCTGAYLALVQKRTIELATLRETMLFASGLAAGLRGGDILTLSGAVGSGKTTLIRTLSYALTGVDQASSPSFTLWQQYGGDITVNHLDLYRIEDERELTELGLHEAFDDTVITFIEWPERAPSLLPPGCMHIVLEGAGDEPRRLEIT